MRRIGEGRCSSPSALWRRDPLSLSVHLACRPNCYFFIVSYRQNTPSSRAFRPSLFKSFARSLCLSCRPPLLCLSLSHPFPPPHFPSFFRMPRSIYVYLALLSFSLSFLFAICASDRILSLSFSLSFGSVRLFLFLSCLRSESYPHLIYCRIVMPASNVYATVKVVRLPRSRFILSISR